MKKTLIVISVLSFAFADSSLKAADIMGAATGAMGVTMSVVMLNSTCNATENKACTAGGNYLKKCSTGVGSAVFCGMAVLSAAQVVMALTAHDKANDVKNKVTCTGSFCSNGDGSGPPGFHYNDPGISDPGITPDQRRLLTKAKKDLESLAKNGYTYDPATNSVGTPSGSVPASAFSSAEGLKKMGASDDLISSVEQATKGKSGVGAIGYNDGSGAGGSRAKSASDKSNFDMAAYMRSLTNKQNAQRSVAGLQVRAGGDAIGVSGDNIFEMITRSYHVQQPTLDQSY